MNRPLISAASLIVLIRSDSKYRVGKKVRFVCFVILLLMLKKILLGFGSGCL